MLSGLIGAMWPYLRDILLDFWHFFDGGGDTCHRLKMSGDWPHTHQTQPIFMKCGGYPSISAKRSPTQQTQLGMWGISIFGPEYNPPFILKQNQCNCGMAHPHITWTILSSLCVCVCVSVCNNDSFNSIFSPMSHTDLNIGTAAYHLVEHGLLPLVFRD